MPPSPSPPPLLSVLEAAERRLDALKARFGRERAPVLVPFRGHATERTVHLGGRVIEHAGLTSVEPTDSPVENLLNMLRRFETDEIPGATVRVEVGTAAGEAVTDEEGYFRVRLPLDVPLPPDRHVHEARISLLGTPRQPDARAHAVADVLAVPDTATFGVISDIDDTVLQTGATDLVRMLTTTLLSNAHTRLPFEGVAAFYRALARGTGSTADNPVFYVSSSPWNLYDLLTDFFDVQGLPRGPLFLKDLGLTRTHLLKSGHGDHKLAVIADLLAAHPRLPFVLLGDSGQHDPEIYAEAVRAHPGRIRAVYLRDVTGEARDAEVRRCTAEMEAAGVAVCYAPDSLEAARHAAALGLVRPGQLDDVAAEKAKDEAPETPASAPGPLAPASARADVAGQGASGTEVAPRA